MLPAVFSNHKNTMPDLTGYVTTEEAANTLGYHVNHVRRMIKNGTLESKRVGHMLFVLSASVTEYQKQFKGVNKHDWRKKKVIVTKK